MQIKRIVVWLCALCASLIFSESAYTQAPTVYHPGDLLSFTVKFDGESASKLTRAAVHLDLTSHLHDDQRAFITYLEVPANAQPRPGVFDTSLRIPDFIASGTYKITHVNTGTSYVNFDYTEDLPDFIIVIENSDHLSRPLLKGVEKTSHP